MFSLQQMRPGPARDGGRPASLLGAAGAAGAAGAHLHLEAGRPAGRPDGARRNPNAATQIGQIDPAHEDEEADTMGTRSMLALQICASERLPVNNQRPKWRAASGAGLRPGRGAGRQIAPQVDANLGIPRPACGRAPARGLGTKDRLAGAVGSGPPLTSG